MDADPGPEAEQPVAQVDVALHGPGGQVEFHGVGMGVGGAAGLEPMGRLRVVPPVLAGQGLGEAGVLDRVALQALAEEGEGPGLTAEAERHQLFGAKAGGREQGGAEGSAARDAIRALRRQLSRGDTRPDANG